MTRFDQLIAEQTARLSEAPGDGVEAPNPNDPADSSQLPPSPTSAEGDVAPADPLTPEGKVFLIDLARKALAFDPNQLPEFDREVLGHVVTADNAEAILKDIQRIIGTN